MISGTAMGFYHQGASSAIVYTHNLKISPTPLIFRVIDYTFQSLGFSPTAEWKNAITLHIAKPSIISHRESLYKWRLFLHKMYTFYNDSHPHAIITVLFLNHADEIGRKRIIHTKRVICLRLWLLPFASSLHERIAFCRAAKHTCISLTAKRPAFLSFQQASI